MSDLKLKILSITKAAEELGIGRRTVEKLISEGQIEVIMVGKTKKIPYRSLEKFVESAKPIMIPRNNGKVGKYQPSLKEKIKNKFKE